MKRISSTCILLALFLVCGCDQPTPKSDPAPPVVAEPPAAEPTSESLENSVLKIRLSEDKTVWQAEVRDVQAVLDSAGAELMKHFPGRFVEPITVHAKGGPITLYDRDSKGGYTVKLNTGNRFWAQCSFQFAHELCHVLSNYREDENPNGWFEESLCEAASLFVLREMGKTWETDPPFSNWKSYSVNLTKYAQDRIDSAALQTRRPLSEWFAVKEMRLRKSQGQRELNNVVAIKLLPLFEEYPAGWETIAWLNVDESFPDDSFHEYLSRWRYYVPKRHREFVEKVAFEFGIAFE
ncbi:hypothetical protein OAE61_01300 [Verrucomicrobiales bacterium]|nr:hypothetical protein [Verrucomicrobiales bacterium]MDB4657479.1 hypothetical protein [Verrucomicrobiales bacterium]MDB4662250.1 hypothetical protein [Verrucomicrobiales bacterium]MDC0275701.1 hypothetical protein [Verrucomicrobiales bacterium]MDC0322382.1 hypothetical protein [Verrucomicrobiales bacterium]